MIGGEQLRNMKINNITKRCLKFTVSAFIACLIITGCNSEGNKVTPSPTLSPTKLPSSKSMISFSLDNTSGIISGNNILVKLPFGTNLNALIANFVTDGNTVKIGNIIQKSGVTPNNFTKNVEYTVIAADGSSKTYKVIVELLENSNKAILSFALNNSPGLIIGNNILVRIPDNTNIQKLVATFTLSPEATLEVNNFRQISGITQHDFTNIQTYTVVAGDGSSREYSVTATNQDSVKSAISSEYSNLMSDIGQCNYSSPCPQYWRIGMSWNVMLTAILLPQELNPNFIHSSINLVNLLNQAYNTFNLPGTFWNDDFEWWAIATQRALATDEIRSLIGQNTGVIIKLETIKNNTWDYAQSGPKAWEDCLQSITCKTYYDPAFRPRYVGGTWNAYFKHSGEANRANSDPTSGSLATRQNTVTNMMYAVYAARGNPDGATDTENNNISNFLNSWLNDSVSEYKMLNYIASNAAIVRERVYVEGDQYYDPTLSWAGDQGIMLGWLLQILNSSTPNKYIDKITALNFAKNILKGFDECFIDNNNHILQWTHTTAEGSCTGTPGTPPGVNLSGNDGDYQDYNTGIAVFLEYLTEAYQNNKDLNDYIRLHTRLPTIIATEAYDDSLGNINTCVNDDCNSFVSSTNNLALYNAYQVIGY